MMFYDSNVSKMVYSVKDRVRDVMVWFPYPALISFGLVALFVGHLIPSLNSRFGSPAQLISFEAQKEPEGSIWISVYPGDDNQIHVKTLDRESFHWPQTRPTSEDLEPFVTYLKGKVEAVQIAAGISKSSDFVKTSAIIASDVKLNYYHIKPVLYALAEARISNYGFETKLPRPVENTANMSDEFNIEKN